MIYCVDIDNTICATEGTNYGMSLPNNDVIKWVNGLYDSGHTIKIFTGRGSRSGKDLEQLTKIQLSAWGVKYHELIFGKPHADFFVDDKAFIPEIYGENSMCNSNPLTNAPWQYGHITARLIAEAHRNYRKVLICGNGGLASESDHFAAELVGKFGADIYLRCISLVSNTALITALANDIGYENVFAHQIEVLGDYGDVFIAMTGGKPDKEHSANITKALTVANRKGLKTVVICGFESGFFEATNVWHLRGMGADMQNQAIRFLHFVALEAKKLVSL